MALFLSKVIRRQASRLVYSEYGIPTEVVKFEKFEQPGLFARDQQQLLKLKTAFWAEEILLVVVVDDNDVVVKMLAAPIHPADINIIQGILTVNVVFIAGTVLWPQDWKVLNHLPT